MVSKKFLGFLYFCITIAILIAALKIVNYLPLAMQKDTMRRYQSIEDVKSKLKIRDIFVPYYFPQDFAWPPSEILAQNKPFTAVVMEFRHAQNRDTALIISQASSKDFSPDRKIKMLNLKERVSYPLKGKNVLLEAGACKNDTPCSSMSWDEGGYRIIVISKSSPPELLKIAESMIR